ncbi:MAG: hypothetical protein JO252_29025 [Planctomycetaceae bacterium]|nr:hypothetical protein [Planctomycetaceae bacterium]
MTERRAGGGARRAIGGRHGVASAVGLALLAGTAALAVVIVLGRDHPRTSVTRTGGRGAVHPVPPGIDAARTASEGPVAVGAVTFAADVAPILQEKCQSCHRPGQVAPFALLTFAQARRWAGPIREAIEDRRMPPWHADPRHGHFANDRSLTARQRATLLAWVDQGMPLGDPRDLPPPRNFPESWAIGMPDVILQMPEPYIVAAQGILPYQRFRVPTHFTRDVWVQAAEARPGDRAVVHHICVFLAPDEPYSEGLTDARRELVCYAPGDLPSVFPPGVAKLIPAGAELVIEVHYTPIGVPRTDRSSVGLMLARQPVFHRAFTKGISRKDLEIPPGAANHAVASSFTFPDDAHLLSLMPHMHLRGKDFRYTAVYPDGRSEVLLEVPAYDFGWQSVYRLVEPRTMPRGTRIDCLAHFDNSAGNPANPDPTKTVRWGEQTYDEMMIGFIDYYEDTPISPTPVAPRPGLARQ